MEFQRWKTNFSAEVCLKTADPQVTMLSIKEVEIAKSMDELMTSRSIVAKDFPDEEDSQHACTLPKKSKCQRAACSKTRPILTRKTNCVHDLRVFPCNWSLWSSTRTRRIVHYEFAEWRVPRFRCTMGSCTTNSRRNAFGRDPGRIIQVKITEFFSTSNCDGLVWSRSCTKQWRTKLSTIKNCCETSNWSNDENSKLQGPERCCGTRISYQGSKRKQSLRWEEKCESFFNGGHMDNVPKETIVVTEVGDEKGDRLLPHPIQRQNRLTARNKNPHRDQAINRKTRKTKMKFHADSNSVKKKSVMWILASSHVSELQVWKGCVRGDKCHFRHVEAEGKPNKKSKKGGAKGSVAILKESIQLGCVSPNFNPRKSIPREPGKLAVKHSAKFSKGTWHQIRTRERKGPSRGVTQKWTPHDRSPCAPKCGERSHEETLIQERCARKAAWDFAKNIHKLKNSDKATF